MSSSFWLLRVESHDFSQAEKERSAYKAKQIYKMTTIFTQMILGASVKNHVTQLKTVANCQ